VIDPVPGRHGIDRHEHAESAGEEVDRRLEDADVRLHAREHHRLDRRPIGGRWLLE
jgi:hypothetical protein